MKFESYRPHELSREDIDVWKSLIGPGNAFDSPFFHPAYVMTMARFRPQIEITVLRDKGQAVGFLAFERHRRKAQPLGIKLADFQGIVSAAHVHINHDELLRETGLVSCSFDHWLADQAPDEYTLEISKSPFIDVSVGYEEFLARRRAAGSNLISQTQRKERKLEREIGPLTFTWNDPDPAALERVWEWKSLQRDRTHTLNILEFEWVRAFLKELCLERGEGVQGIVSTLRLEDRIIAAHLGMHSDSVLHYWFPAFDAEFGRYSPGSILLLKLTEHCAQRGMSRIDLGKGDDRYKASFATGAIPMATGTADRSAVRQLIRSSVYRAKTWIKTSSLRSAAQIPKRAIGRWQTQKAMQTK